MFNRFVKGNAVDGIRFFPCTHIVNQLVERVVYAVMRRDDMHLAAPHQQGHCRFKQFAELFVERCFINNHAALFTA